MLPNRGVEEHEVSNGGHGVRIVANGIRLEVCKSLQNCQNLSVLSTSSSRERKREGGSKN